MKSKKLTIIAIGLLLVNVILAAINGNIHSLIGWVGYTITVIMFVSDMDDKINNGNKKK